MIQLCTFANSSRRANEVFITQRYDRRIYIEIAHFSVNETTNLHILSTHHSRMDDIDGLRHCEEKQEEE